MRTITGKLYRDSSRDNFWTKVELVSGKQQRKTEVLLCASYEYLCRDLKANKINDKALEKWVLRTITDFQKKGDSIFRKQTHLEVRAVTSDGYKNGISFLKENVLKPRVNKKHTSNLKEKIT